MKFIIIAMTLMLGLASCKMETSTMDDLQGRWVDEDGVVLVISGNRISSPNTPELKLVVKTETDSTISFARYENGVHTPDNLLRAYIKWIDENTVEFREQDEYRIWHRKN
jgi:hypothetical protein